LPGASLKFVQPTGTLNVRVGSNVLLAWVPAGISPMRSALQ
jgi:hypothetical protein